jgi:hypothetical protein
MNYTIFSCSASVGLGYVAGAIRTFAEAWVSSLELRVAVFILVVQCCFMIWVNVLVREVARTATTVLCRLLVYDSEVSGAPRSHTQRTPVPASAPCTRHMRDGGPPPGPPPPGDVEGYGASSVG